MVLQMRSTLTIFTALLISFAAACNTTGVPTEFANACNPDNEKKTIEINGMIAAPKSVFCSNTGGRMDCGFELLESPGSDKKVRLDIEQGTGANSVTKLESGYKSEDIKIRDNGGNQIGLGTDKLKLTGQMSIEPKMNVCFMKVYKIEK